jgi:transposase
LRSGYCALTPRQQQAGVTVRVKAITFLKDRFVRENLGQVRQTAQRMCSNLADERIRDAAAMMER